MSGATFIAKRLFFRGHRNRSQGHPLLGASLGIALSLIPLITVDHFASAMIEGIIARYRETSSYHFQIHSWDSRTQNEWLEFLERFPRETGVKSVWMERTGFALVRAKGSREGVKLRALPLDAPQRDPTFERYIEFDEGLWNLSENSILLGRESARRLRASVGDKVLVLTSKRLPNTKIIPKVSTFIVRGIFSSGYQDLDRTWAFISLEQGWKIMSDESCHTFIGGKFNDISKDSSLWTELKNSIPVDWTLLHWREINRYLLGNLSSTREILVIIMALIIVVAVLNVTNSLMMLTLEHRREIGILKCTGTSPNTITWAFLFTGTMTSIIGTISGLGLGVLISYFINSIIASIEWMIGVLSSIVSKSPPPSLLNQDYYLQEITITINWHTTLTIGIITLILSILASWLPAFRAAKLSPLVVLHKH